MDYADSARAMPRNHSHPAQLSVQSGCHHFYEYTLCHRVEDICAAAGTPKTTAGQMTSFDYIITVLLLHRPFESSMSEVNIVAVRE